MDITITNISGSSQYVGDLYTSLAAGGSVTLSNRTPADVSGMRSVQALVAAGSVTVSIAPTAAELASGMLSPSQTVGAGDVSPVAATDKIALCEVVRIPMASGGAAGTPDDVTAYALNALPYKCRVIDAWAVISTAAGASTLDVRTASAGAGSSLVSLPSAATGVTRVSTTLTATAVATPGSGVGLFIRRSDRSVVGELYLLIRRES